MKALTNSVTSGPDRWKVAGLVLLALIGLLMLLTVSDYGMTWDEEFHNTYGEYVLAWFETGFKDERALHYKNSYIYGALFDAVALLFARSSPFGLYEDRHIVNVLFAILALAGTRRLGSLLLGARGGTLSMVIAASTPMFYGHSFNNPKDIPFAALFVWALCYLYKSTQSLPAISKSALTKSCLGFGALLAIRPGGIFFLAYIVLWWSLSLWRVRATRRDVQRAAQALICLMLGAWILMLTFWPWGQVNPIVHPLAGIAMASRFSFVMSMTTLFRGQQVPAHDAPLSYLPTWFGLQLPEIYFLAGAAAILGYIFARRRTFYVDLGFVGFVVLFPLATAMILRSTLYDAVRHFLFLVPTLAVLAAAGIEGGLHAQVPRAARVLIACTAIATTTVTVWDMVVLHPYQSVYFNRVFAGGLPGVSGRFETDYWGNSYREAVEWVMRNVPGQGIRIANCSDALQSKYYLRGLQGARFVHVSMEDHPDLLLATTRWNCHQRADARVLHTIERQGVPLAYILDLRAERGARGLARPLPDGGTASQAAGRLR